MHDHQGLGARLTRQDTVLLTETVRETLNSQFRLGLSWTAVKARAEQAGLTKAAVVESCEALTEAS